LCHELAGTILLQNHNFYSGLSDEVKDIICMKDEPNSLEEYMKRAQDIDERLSERKEEKREAYRQGAS
jgi:hypothetical protein